MIYYDYSTARLATGTPVGIPRVVDNVYGALKEKAAVTPVYYEPTTRTFKVLDRETLRDSAEGLTFSPADSLVALGCSWDFAGYNQTVRTLKATRGIRFAHLFHDIIPCLYPHYIPLEGAENYRQWFLETYQLMDWGITISRNSRQDIQRFAAEAGLAPKSVEIIRLGDPEFGEEVPFSPGFGEYVLSVGTLETRKNQGLLLDAWLELIREGVRMPGLIMVGKIGWQGQQVAEKLNSNPVLKDQVRLLSKIGDGELRSLYTSCLFTVYPSLYEGWGLPIAESLSLGKVCLASNTSSMTEIAPGLTVHADPGQVSDWIRELRKLVTDRDYLHRLEVQVKSGYRRGSWSVTVEQLLQSFPSGLSTQK